MSSRAVGLRRGARVAVAAVIGWLGVAGHAAANCVATAAEAERAWSIPSGLLLAIGQVESGRYDPDLRAVAPWPWTVNAGGQGVRFADAASAAAHVAHLQQQGIQSIDVGCFQVNLMQHPAAFASPAEGFDPARNADYAGRFLASLHLQTGDWPAAAARYHSATPGLGDTYRARVLAAWSNPGLALHQDAVARVPSPSRPVLAVFSVRVVVPGEPRAKPLSRTGPPRVIVPGQVSSLLRLAGAVSR